MPYTRQLSELKSQLSTHLPSVITARACQETIQAIASSKDYEQFRKLSEYYIEQFSQLIFTGNVSDFLTEYYGGNFTWRWPVLDVVDDNANANYDSTSWHRDTGMHGMLKVFLYLNSVQEHGCNTLLIDEARSDKLRAMGALPVELSKRHRNVSNYLEAMGSTKNVTSYDMNSGDILLFNPIRLAHRCHPPDPGRKRYTICYSVFPASAFR